MCDNYESFKDYDCHACFNHVGGTGFVIGAKNAALFVQAGIFFKIAHK